MAFEDAVRDLFVHTRTEGSRPIKSTFPHVDIAIKKNIFIQVKSTRQMDRNYLNLDIYSASPFDESRYLVEGALTDYKGLLAGKNTHDGELFLLVGVYSNDVEHQHEYAKEYQAHRLNPPKTEKERFTYKDYLSEYDGVILHHFNRYDKQGEYHRLDIKEFLTRGFSFINSLVKAKRELPRLPKPEAKPEPKLDDSDSLKPYEKYIRKDFRITKLSADLLGLYKAKDIIETLADSDDTSQGGAWTLMGILSSEKKIKDKLQLNKKRYSHLYTLLGPMVKNSKLLYISDNGFRTCKDYALEVDLTYFHLSKSLPKKIKSTLFLKLVETLNLKKLIKGRDPEVLAYNVFAFGYAGPSYFHYFLECLKESNPKKIKLLDGFISKTIAPTTPYSTTCKHFPNPKAKPKAKPEAKPKVKPEPKPKAKPEPKLEVKPEAKPEPKLEVKPEAKPEPKLEVKPDVVTDKSGQTLLFDKPSYISINGVEVDLSSFLLMLSGHPHLSKVEKDSATNLARACVLRRIDINHLGRK
jgi:hypothetical protein